MAEVNRIVKQFEQSKKLMKQLPGMMGAASAKAGLADLAGMMGKMQDCRFKLRNLDNDRQMRFYAWLINNFLNNHRR